MFILTPIDATSAEVIANYDVVSPVITHKEGAGVRYYIKTQGDTVL